VKPNLKLGVAEAALGQPAVHRHLAAFETLDAHAGARGLAFAAAPAGLAGARADAATDAEALLPRAVLRGDFVQLHRRLLISRPRRGRDASLFRSSRAS